jgi:hypothetical protein
MEKEQLIQIAKAGFPQRVKDFINFDNCEMHSMSGVYRLYDKESVFFFMQPSESNLNIFIGADNFIQITCGNRAFNHYAAIKKMEELGLIKDGYAAPVGKMLGINSCGMLIKSMPLDQAIQLMKSDISGQPETAVIDGQLVIVLIP